MGVYSLVVVALHLHSPWWKEWVGDSEAMWMRWDGRERWWHCEWHLLSRLPIISGREDEVASAIFRRYGKDWESKSLSLVLTFKTPLSAFQKKKPARSSHLSLYVPLFPTNTPFFWSSSMTKHDSNNQNDQAACFLSHSLLLLISSHSSFTPSRSIQLNRCLF